MQQLMRQSLKCVSGHSRLILILSVTVQLISDTAGFMEAIDDDIIVHEWGRPFPSDSACLFVPPLPGTSLKQKRRALELLPWMSYLQQKNDVII